MKFREGEKEMKSIVRCPKLVIESAKLLQGSAYFLISTSSIPPFVDSVLPLPLMLVVESAKLLLKPLSSYSNGIAASSSLVNQRNWQDSSSSIEIEQIGFLSGRKELLELMMMTQMQFGVCESTEPRITTHTDRRTEQHKVLGRVPNIWRNIITTGHFNHLLCLKILYIYSVRCELDLINFVLANSLVIDSTNFQPASDDVGRGFLKELLSRCEVQYRQNFRRPTSIQER